MESIRIEDNPDRYAIEQAIARLESSQNQINAFMVHVKWIVSVVSSIVLVVVDFVSFFSLSNLKDISQQVAAEAKSLVRQEIQTHGQRVTELGSLNELLRKAQTDYEENRAAIDALSTLKVLPDARRKDPFFAYERLEALGTSETNAANRAAALSLLQLIIDAGIDGVADPNTLFNASSEAADNNFYLEAAKLAVLAAHWRPTSSHLAQKAQMTEVLGRDFVLTDGELQQRDATPSVVRKEAWISLLKMVRQAPRVESEQIYSSASNVAVRNRNSGYFQQLGAAIVESDKSNPDRLTSFAYAVLANMQAWEGEPGWEKTYWDAVTGSLRALKDESAAATWQPQTTIMLIETAVSLGFAELLLEKSEAEGVPPEVWEPVLGQLSAMLGG